MKFSEAMEYYEQGKPIRLKSWSPNHKLQKNRTGSYIDVATFSQEWELFDDSVEVQTLKEGDLFEYQGTVNRLLPAYMSTYIPGHSKDKLPYIEHYNNKCFYGYISVNEKVKKVNG